MKPGQSRDYNEYTRIEHSPIDGRVYYDCYDDSGLNKYMNGHNGAVATFGQFEIALDENTGRRVTRWTVYTGSDSDIARYGIEEIRMSHEASNGEYWDDKAALMAGNVEWF